ncbi:hypothetical protein NDU88_000822 [Pleurodeles waltl]|uniref:Uncharacterized protein n=1 Tax=Pleurodeles waltl TaxID=8319 RepID=A0AAV7Q2H7_PLEWA|nr:hypothetical protein NDU88_000822 [Pleurodeles waltl]
MRAGAQHLVGPAYMQLRDVTRNCILDVSQLSSVLRARSRHTSPVSDHAVAASGRPADTSSAHVRPHRVGARGYRCQEVQGGQGPPCQWHKITGSRPVLHI